MQPTAAALHNVCANERVVLDWNYSNLFQTWLPDSQYIRRLRARTHAAIDRQQLKTQCGSVKQTARHPAEWQLSCPILSGGELTQPYWVGNRGGTPKRPNMDMIYGPTPPDPRTQGAPAAMATRVGRGAESPESRVAQKRRVAPSRESL